MNDHKWYPLFIFFFLSLHPLVFGQMQTALDTITVEALRIPLTPGETGRNITVLSGRAIEKMVFTSLDDLLQYIPGIEVQSRSAFGVQGDITMRGATFTQVMVLVDGMKLNDPLTGHFNSYIPVTPAEIERIEVLHGSASAVYGADAVGGVINIVTRGFRQPSDDSRVMGQMSYGEHRLVNAQQGFFYTNDRAFVSGGFQMNQSDGEAIPEKAVDNATLEGYDHYFNLKTVGLSMGYRLSENWRLRARTAYDDRDFSARFFYTASPFDKSVETTRSWWNQLRLTKTGAGGTTDAHLAYRKGTDRFVFSPDFPSTNLHTTHFLNLNISHLQRVSDDLSLMAGGQWDRRSVESTDRGNHHDLHYGAFVTGSLQPDKQLNLTGSLRLDYDDNYSLEFTPQLNVSYVLSAVTFRASAGRSIRAADYTERYVSFNLVNLTPGRNLGNPALAAERAWSEEVGLDYRLSRFWQLKATAFSRQSSNLIDYAATNERDIPNNQRLQSGGEYLYATNITDVQTRGVEIESWFNTVLGNRGRLQGSLGYAYLKTRNDDDVISVYISSHAGHLVSTNLVFESGRLLLAINGLYKQRDARIATAINARLEKDYQVWNIRLGYQLTRQVGLNLHMHNLFDASYQDILGAPMPGRWLMGGIGFALPFE